jgi:TatD DNase family protein
MELPPSPEALPISVVDTHCHLDIEDGDLYLTPAQALERATSVGVDRIVQVGVDVESSRWGVELAAKTDRILATVAIHPNEAPRIFAEQGQAALDSALAEIAELAKHPRVRAIGETGLDFFRTETDLLAVQEESFRAHIQIAKDNDKALIIHDRDAHDDVVRVLQSEGAPKKVVFHCFSGDESLARIAAENGWYCSFSGTVTFRNSHNLRSALTVLPPELILIETDAPFLTPTPYRGRPNASYLIPITARFMADVRGMELASLCKYLSDNAESVFGNFSNV